MKPMQPLQPHGHCDRMTPDTLKSWRAALGLTQAGAAEALGIAVATYRDWEQGRYAPQSPKLVGLACAAVVRRVKPWAPKENPASPVRG